MLTIAKDVKIQVEFNPSHVQAYRLIGYENRKLNDEDFNDDKKDAGELGAGHTVTALYEIIPQGVESSQLPDIDKLKYQDRSVNSAQSDELLTVKFRYKDPNGSKSKLIAKTLKNGRSNRLSQNFMFSAAVAGFGMLLRDSEFKGDLTWEQVAQMAKISRGDDPEGYRAEFIRMVEKAGLLASNRS
ncbi:MAG: DUF3520 domain-containing protein [Chitinivibrionales bacterium]|nr:DUF3520 domain-containing protein [Chitinivibrionales bacterium]